MGIPDFLKRVLESAGRPCDLSDYATGITSKKRPLRIGLDVSTWIYTSAYAYGDMLGDERHLSNYGRASLMQQQQQENAMTVEQLSEETIQKYIATCVKHVMQRLQVLKERTCADILIVLDGKAPPIKKREVTRRRLQRQEQEALRDQPVDPHQSPTHINQIRTKANRRAGAGKYHQRILKELVTALREAQQPFLVAPYEADAQLAYLSDMGYLDLVISEDSDLVAHGTKAVLFKLTLDPPQGKLLKFSDLGAGEHWNLASFTPVMMTILFVALGCDYCDKLKGIGIVTATRAIQNAFLSDQSQSSSASKLTRIWEELYTKSYLNKRSLTKQFKKDYEEQFMAAIFMFRHAIVYDPLQERNVIVSRRRINKTSELYMDHELMDHEPYVKLCRDFDRIQEIVGKLWSKELAMKWAQGYGGGWMRSSSHEEEEDVREEQQPVVGNNAMMPAIPLPLQPTQEDAQESQLDTQDDAHLFATQDDIRLDKRGNDKDPSVEGREEMPLTQPEGNDPMEEEPTAEEEDDDDAMLLTQPEGIASVAGGEHSRSEQEESMLLSQDDNDPVEGEPSSTQEGSQKDGRNPTDGTVASSSEDEFFDTQTFVPQE